MFEEISSNKSFFHKTVLIIFICKSLKLQKRSNVIKSIQNHYIKLVGNNSLIIKMSQRSVKRSKECDYVCHGAYCWVLRTIIECCLVVRVRVRESLSMWATCRFNVDCHYRWHALIYSSACVIDGCLQFHS